MQLATVDDGQPWVCTVHYVADDDFNFYWLSLPARRHSQEVEKHGKAAVTVAIKFDRPVIGIQAEGSAKAVTDKRQIAKAMKSYVEKFNAGQKFYENVVSGQNQHVMYQLTPSHLYLFDEVNYPDKGRQEV